MDLRGVSLNGKTRGWVNRRGIGLRGIDLRGAGMTRVTPDWVTLDWVTLDWVTPDWVSRNWLAVRELRTGPPLAALPAEEVGDLTVEEPEHEGQHCRIVQQSAGQEIGNEVERPNEIHHGADQHHQSLRSDNPILASRISADHA
jgi:hypothetical protein